MRLIRASVDAPLYERQQNVTVPRDVRRGRAVCRDHRLVGVAHGVRDAAVRATHPRVPPYDGAEAVRRRRIGNPFASRQVAPRQGLVQGRCGSSRDHAPGRTRRRCPTAAWCRRAIARRQRTIAGGMTAPSVAEHVTVVVPSANCVPGRRSHPLGRSGPTSPLAYAVTFAGTVRTGAVDVVTAGAISAATDGRPARRRWCDGRTSGLRG
jgi:hypothetical protein